MSLVYILQPHNTPSPPTQSYIFFFIRCSQWLKNMYSAEDVIEHIVKLAKKGLTPSKIGV